jgi:hypothetical protein
MKPHVQEALAEEMARQGLDVGAEVDHDIVDYDHLRFELRRGPFKSKTRVLRTPRGDTPVAEIGRGMFAVAYREQVPPGRVFSVVDDDVYDKEILTMVEGKHIPKVERFGATVDGKKVYAMPFYKAPLRRGDNSKAWKDYKTLKKCSEDIHHKNAFKPHESGYDQNIDTIECGRSADVTDSVLEDLDALALMAANYDADAYFFEFAPRNLATDEQKNLILLDVLFDKKKAKQFWT